MARYEYKVVPAPNRGVKGKGIKGAEARFSHGLEELMNSLAAAGWEYQRAETLPSLERAGLTSTSTEWRNVLVFRRPFEETATELLPAPAPQDRHTDGTVTTAVETADAADPAGQPDATPDSQAASAPGT
ncbi:DUF4177 domain-containing protein [Sulfitobacter aestuarii]|uniref:DUF4177 domain-containing protein n=1 Tax=Sulfitobacter aestuarii TaxID=2161676 RepID=A0ABW5TZI0_9RHOB